MTSRHVYELKNTAKTKGHSVSKMSPQMLILPSPSPNTCHLLAEKRTFQVGNSIQWPLTKKELTGTYMDDNSLKLTAL